MLGRVLARHRNAILWSAVTLAVLAFGALLFATSGLYSVAASRGHFAVTRWMLEFGMRRSVATHSLGISTPPLDDMDLVRLGAGHFYGGCAPCHGAPGDTRNPVVANMLPPPPSLAQAAPTWSTSELFWIVRNGLKYTGMPAWPEYRRDDEVWAVVAFLRKLPTMEAAEYKALATGHAQAQRRTANELARLGSGQAAASACGAATATKRRSRQAASFQGLQDNPNATWQWRSGSMQTVPDPAASCARLRRSSMRPQLPAFHDITRGYGYAAGPYSRQKRQAVKSSAAGRSPSTAWRQAAYRLAWPVIAGQRRRSRSSLVNIRRIPSDNCVSSAPAYGKAPLTPL